MTTIKAFVTTITTMTVFVTYSAQSKNHFLKIIFFISKIFRHNEFFSKKKIKLSSKLDDFFLPWTCSSKFAFRYNNFLN